MTKEEKIKVYYAGIEEAKNVVVRAEDAFLTAVHVLDLGPEEVNEIVGKKVMDVPVVEKVEKTGEEKIK